MAIEFTEAEKVFMARMLPHFMAGKSVEQAAAAVIEDDARIFSAFMDRGRNEYVPTVDERGRAIYSGDRPGDMIAAELTTQVYNRIRSA